MKPKGKGSYDYENDIYYSRQIKREYESSIQFDDIVLDLDINGNIVGIEIFNASKVLRVPKYYLNNIKNGNFQFFIKEKKIIINIDLIFSIRNGYEKSFDYIGENIGELINSNSNYAIV